MIPPTFMTRTLSPVYLKWNLHLHYHVRHFQKPLENYKGIFNSCYLTPGSFIASKRLERSILWRWLFSAASGRKSFFFSFSSKLDVHPNLRCQGALSHRETVMQHSYEWEAFEMVIFLVVAAGWCPGIACLQCWWYFCCTRTNFLKGQVLKCLASPFASSWRPGSYNCDINQCASSFFVFKKYWNMTWATMVG